MKAVLLDIDGTTLLGPQALPGAVEFVRALRADGIPHLWLTNNSSMSRGAWLERLAAAGLEPRPEELYTSGDAAIDLLRALSPAPRVHLVGTRDLRRDFAAAGVILDDEAPDTLVLGYDTELTYEKVRRAALWLRAGVTYYATHPDVTCPTPDGPIPDVGAFMAMFERATGRVPRVLGKPEATMAAGALARLGVEARDACMVGDRLATDMRMARRAGLTACLVLTGVTDRRDLAAAAEPPDHVFADLAALGAWIFASDADETARR